MIKFNFSHYHGNLKNVLALRNYPATSTILNHFSFSKDVIPLNIFPASFEYKIPPNMLPPLPSPPLKRKFSIRHL